jgi:hypothetical protein
LRSLFTIFNVKDWSELWTNIGSKTLVNRECIGLSEFMDCTMSNSSDKATLRCKAKMLDGTIRHIRIQYDPFTEVFCTQQNDQDGCQRCMQSSVYFPRDGSQWYKMPQVCPKAKARVTALLDKEVERLQLHSHLPNDPEGRLQWNNCHSHNIYVVSSEVFNTFKF